MIEKNQFYSNDHPATLLPVSYKQPMNVPVRRQAIVQVDA